MSDLKKCPICGTPMAIERRYGIEIDVCRAHGVWLDNGELARLTLAVRGKQPRDAREALAELPDDAPAEPAGPQAPAVRQPCAVCGKKMPARPVYGQTVRFCPLHGFWLDRSALVGIIRAARQKPPSSSGAVPIISDVADWFGSSDTAAWAILDLLLSIMP